MACALEKIIMVEVSGHIKVSMSMLSMFFNLIHGKQYLTQGKIRILLKLSMFFTKVINVVKT